MADVELVIKIPDQVYQYIMKDFPDMFWSPSIKEAILNSTLLPKGHGDLIDRNSINQIIKPIDDNDDEWLVTGETAKKLIRDAFDKAETIIKADKETSSCE